MTKSDIQYIQFVLTNWDKLIKSDDPWVSDDKCTFDIECQQISKGFKFTVYPTYIGEGGHCYTDVSPENILSTFVIASDIGDIESLNLDCLEW